MVLLQKDGSVIRDALLWNDLKSAPEALELMNEMGKEFFVKRVGLVLVASFTVSPIKN